MTQEERNEKLERLNEKQMALMSVMRESDAHASKCIKLGLEFAKEYPEEYKVYEDAREKYNSNEAEIAELLSIEILEIDEHEGDI